MMKKVINFIYLMSIIITLLINPSNANASTNAKVSDSLIKETDIKQNDEKFYMVFINKSNTNDHEKRQDNDEFVNSMVDEIHNLIIGNKDSYKDQEKFEEIEQQSSQLKKRDSPVHYLKDYGDSSYVYPIFTNEEKTILYAYLSDDLKETVESMPNISAVRPPITYEPDTADYNEEDIKKETKWSKFEVQNKSPLHLSLISQGKYDQGLIGEYDSNYYYPSSAGKDIDIFIFDGGFNFKHSEFSNKDEREAKCVLHIVEGKISNTPNTEYCYSAEVSESSHGTKVATVAGGLKYGVARKANIYGVLMENYDNVNAIAGLQYVKDNLFRPGKAIFNFSFGGYTSYQNFTQNEEYQTFQNLINEMSEEGAVFFSSAGNANLNTYDIENDVIKDPCSFENEICVGGIGNLDTESLTYTKYKYSNYGKNVDIYAPYHGIVGFQDKYFDNYVDNFRGTSFSTPIAAGVAATIMSENPKIKFNSKSMLLYLYKLGERNIVQGIPEDYPNVFINNGKHIVYSNNNEYKGCGVHSGNYQCGENECCSVDGHCSTDENVCKSSEGCQKQFGKCEIVYAPKNRECGKGYGNCKDGYCCSAQGYCGKTDGHCGIGCQIDFGICY